MVQGLRRLLVHSGMRYFEPTDVNGAKEIINLRGERIITQKDCWNVLEACLPFDIAKYPYYVNDFSFGVNTSIAGFLLSSYTTVKNYTS